MQNLPCGLPGGCCRCSTVKAKTRGKDRPESNRSCLHSIPPQGLSRGETIRGEWGIWSPGGRPAGAASSLFGRAILEIRDVRFTPEKRTFLSTIVMSAFCQKADSCAAASNGHRAPPAIRQPVEGGTTARAPHVRCSQQTGAFRDDRESCARASHVRGVWRARSCADPRRFGLRALPYDARNVRTPAAA
jgi:hypothetical protein